VSIGQSTLTGWVSLAVFAAALAMTQLLKWNPLVVLAVSTLLGTGAWVLGWVERLSPPAAPGTLP
jgi:hypothetical protein